MPRMILTDEMRAWAAEHAPDVDALTETERWAEKDEFLGPWAYPVTPVQVRRWKLWLRMVQESIDEARRLEDPRPDEAEQLLLQKPWPADGDQLELEERQ